MIFKVPELYKPITKELLKSQNSEETYMSTYLGIPISKGLLVSPLRSDHKPTASFYRNKNGELIFHDFGIGFHGNFIDVVMYLYKCSYAEALQRIGKDFGLIPSEQPRTINIRKSTIIIEEHQDTSIQIEKQNFTEGELKWWKSFGVSLPTLRKFKVYSCKSIFLNGNYFKSSSVRHYIFGYYGGKKDKIELWRIYFPQNKTFRFMSNWTKSIIQGAKQLPMSGDNLIISKSLKDTMVLYEQSISAIAPCSENTMISQAQINKLKRRYKNIYAFLDNDLAGVRGAHAYKKLYPDIRCIFLKRKWAKDISDLHRDKGITHFNKAIEELKYIFNNPTVRSTTYFYIF